MKKNLNLVKKEYQWQEGDLHLLEKVLEEWHKSEVLGKGRITEKTKENFKRALGSNKDLVVQTTRKYVEIIDKKDFFYNYKTTFGNWVYSLLPRYVSERRSKQKFDSVYEKFLEETGKIEEDYFDIVGYKEVLEDLKSIDYQEYLLTEHWRHFRREAIKFYNNKCKLCNGTKGLQVHHKTYDNRGRETFNDVILLCNECHKKIHNK